eukprot:g3151.t1
MCLCLNLDSAVHLYDSLRLILGEEACDVTVTTSEEANPDEISKESASKKQKVGNDDEQEELWLATSQQVHVLTTQMDATVLSKRMDKCRPLEFLRGDS